MDLLKEYLLLKRLLPLIIDEEVISLYLKEKLMRKLSKIDIEDFMMKMKVNQEDVYLQ